MTVRPFQSIILSLFIAAWCLKPVAAQANAPKQAAKQSSEIVLASEVKWEPLNPLRGDQSPKAGTLWGDRNGAKPTGFLVKFVDGFSSPPHIHNITYRGVVIHGLVHNDDPNAEKMWMPAGSFWTQPKGEVHITAAKGGATVAYIEIDKGPYLVRPPKEVFDSGERPINVDVSNIVWLEQPGMPASANGAKIAFLWGIPHNDGPNGSLVRLQSGFTGELQGQGPALRAVVIQGRIKYGLSSNPDVKMMEPGSYFGSTGGVVHHISCAAEKQCLIYVRTKGKFKVSPTKPK